MKVEEAERNGEEGRQRGRGLRRMEERKGEERSKRGERVARERERDRENEGCTHQIGETTKPK